MRYKQFIFALSIIFPFTLNAASERLSLDYDIDITDLSVKGMHICVSVNMQNCEVNDSVLFVLGNPLSELWANGLILTGAVGHFYSSDNKLIVYTNAPTTSFKVIYDYMPWISLLNNNDRVAIFDNYEYEKYLPVCTTENSETKIVSFVVKTQENYSVEIPVDPYHPDLDLRYLSLICINDSLPPQTCTGCSWDIRLFDTSLSDEEMKRLDLKLQNFFSLANQRLWIVEEPKIIEMNYVGNTTYGSYMIISPKDFRSLVLFHELMHLWCPSKLYVENCYGFYILSETLNEYLMNMYYSTLFGREVLQTVIDNKKELWKKHCRDSSGSLASQSKYVLSNHYLITCYGFLQFDEFAQKVGRDNFIGFLESFLKEAYRNPLTYEDFKTTLVQHFGNGSELLINSLESSNY